MHLELKSLSALPRLKEQRDIEVRKIFTDEGGPAFGDDPNLLGLTQITMPDKPQAHHPFLFGH